MSLSACAKETDGGSPLKRETNNRFQTAQHAFIEGDVTAMGAGDVAGDGQAQARTAALQIAALIQAMKGPEGFLAPVFGNARPVIFHRDFGMMLALAQIDRD